jgi:Ca2+-binding EF-hand superfamily protein
MCSSKSDAKAALTKAFNQVDTDHSGSIDASELEKVLQSYYKSAGKPVDAGKIKSDTAAFLQEVDKNHDNKVNLDEFINFFMQFC